MGSKPSSNRKFEVDLIQLHHVTGPERDELVAKLLFTILEESQAQIMKKRKRMKRSPPDEEQGLSKPE